MSKSNSFKELSNSTERNEDDIMKELKQYEKEFESICNDNEFQRKQRTFRCQSLYVSEKEKNDFLQGSIENLETETEIQQCEASWEEKDALKFNIEIQIDRLDKKRKKLIEELFNVENEINKLKQSLNTLETLNGNEKVIIDSPKKRRKQYFTEENPLRINQFNHETEIDEFNEIYQTQEMKQRKKKKQITPRNQIIEDEFETEQMREKERILEISNEIQKLQNENK